MNMPLVLLQAEGRYNSSYEQAGTLSRTRALARSGP